MRDEREGRRRRKMKGLWRKGKERKGGGVCVKEELAF